MRRASRDFMNARQDHSHAVVCVCQLQPYPHRLSGDIVEAVGQEVRSNPEWRAVAGWRVHDWDGESVRFEPWWWLAKPDAQRGWTWWDVQSDGKDYDYIMDHDLCIARILELEQRLAVRPCDLIHKGDAWFLDGEHGLTEIEELTTRNILSLPRPTRVTFDISLTTQDLPAFSWNSIAIPQVTTSTAGTKS